MKPSLVVLIRMAIVLVFLLGMPLLALPRVPETLRAWLWPDEHREGGAAAGDAATAERPLNIIADEAPPTQSHPAGSELDELKARFVDLGATYMLLERVGVDGSRFRFRCNVPVVEGSGYLQRFEVVGEEPGTVMSAALRQAEEWRAAATRSQGALARPRVRLR